MAMKQKCLDLNVNLEVICLTEVGGLSKSKVTRWESINFSDIVHILKKRDKI
jgi:hypothetical protein